MRTTTTKTKLLIQTLSYLLLFPLTTIASENARLEADGTLLDSEFVDSVGLPLEIPPEVPTLVMKSIAKTPLPEINAFSELPPPIPISIDVSGLPPILPPPLSALPPPPAGSHRITNSASTSASKNPQVFLSRTQIEAQRSGCSVQITGTPSIEIGKSETTLELPYSLSLGARCLSGAAPTVSWVDVIRASESGVTVLIKSNDTGKVRQGEVTVVARNGTSSSFFITQLAVVSDSTESVSNDSESTNAQKPETSPAAVERIRIPSQP